ncbi:MAG: hypothetical protein Q8M16_17255 [Pirellulaceae bacterium]|nr:hypothetical protein [Pirellulaceae bacterium]
MNQSPAQVRIAIIETAEATSSVGLAPPILRAATIVGVPDRVHLWRALDAAATSDLDLLVLSQLTPAEIPPSTLAGWRSQHPLARQVTVWGPWCIGGHRNGFPDSGTSYVSWLSWPWQIQCFLRQYFGGQSTLWDLPATRTTADRLARAANALVSSLPSQQSPALVATFPSRIDLVPAPSGMADALPEACAGLGWNTRVWGNIAELIRVPASERAPIWIWEPEVPQVSLTEIVRLREQLPGAGIILLGYAEILGVTAVSTAAGLIQDLSHALSANSATVLLPKPFLFSELQAAICDLSFQNGGSADGF